MQASFQSAARRTTSLGDVLERSAGQRRVGAVGVAAGAIGLWALSLPQIHVYSLGRYGLAPGLPATWYLALALLICGAVASSWGARPNGALTALYIAGIVAVLFATVPAITPVPHYAWVYKHIGVTRSINTYGGVNFASGDIYHRWPGFFAFAAVFSRLAGTDPLSFAAWAEPFFALVDALLVAVVARSITRDIRVAGYAALIFTLGSWVGQAYFAPQALAYTLAFVLLLVFVRAFTSGPIQPWIRRLTEKVIRREQPPATFATALPWSRPTSIAIVLALDVVIVATHQLTPYVLVLELGALTVLGVARPRWLFMAMGAITVGYLAPNLGFVVHNYGLFSGLNPTRNIQGGSWGAPHVDWLDSNAGGVLSAVLIIGMLVSAVWLARLGRGSEALPLLVLASAPFGILLAQNYGGEASLRVFLFSSPWRDVLVALGIGAIARPRLRMGAALAMSFVLAYLFVAAFYGEEEFNAFQRGEVTASEYFYSHAPSGSVLLLSAPDFPTKSGPRYSLMAGSQAEDGLNIAGTGTFQDRPLGPAQVPAVVSLIHQYSRKGYVAFSTTEYKYANIKELTPPGQLESLERAVAASGLFRLWYSSPDTRIYELSG
jgi:hypothetical protein